MSFPLSMTTKLWVRGDSYASTIPKPILMMKEVPVENCEVEWQINKDGDVTVSFSEREDDE